MKRRLPLLALALTGCVVGPNYRPPASPAVATGQLREAQVAGVTATPLPPRWWRLFDDPALDRLVDRALVNNTDLRQAAANLQRARAILSEARAARLPTSEVTAQYQRLRVGGGTTAGFGAGTGGGTPPTIDLFTAGFDASYEVDLFGGVTRSIQAARADIGAAQAQVDASRVSVAAETARAYAQGCSYAAQAEVARETAALQGRTLDLTQRLYAGGRGTARDVARAQVLVEQANAQVPTFEAERRAALYALAFLTGDTPEQVDAEAARCTSVPQVRDAIPVGDGQALLARRPDVHQAERQLAGDVARIGVATADLYPHITLLGSPNIGATKLGDLGKAASFGFSVGPSISWAGPFNGAARARVRQSRAVADRSLAAFDGAVLEALKETEQALARLGGVAQSEAAYARAAAASEEAARLSDVRFRDGADSFLQLLDAQRDRATARAQLAQAHADRADAQVSLFKALGGGWEEAPPVREPDRSYRSK